MYARGISCTIIWVFEYNKRLCNKETVAKRDIAKDRLLNRRTCESRKEVRDIEGLRRTIFRVIHPSLRLGRSDDCRTTIANAVAVSDSHAMKLVTQDNFHANLVRNNKADRRFFGEKKKEKRSVSPLDCSVTTLDPGGWRESRGTSVVAFDRSFWGRGSLPDRSCTPVCVEKIITTDIYFVRPRTAHRRSNNDLTRSSILRTS